MKIIHVSDLHLDSALTTRLDSKKVRERKSELLLSFRKIVESAISKNADAVIIAGDLFDTDKVGKRTLKNVLDVISAAPHTAFLYLSGNHEKRAMLESGLQLPKNLKTFEDEWTSFEFGSVTVVGRCESAPNMFDSLVLDKSRVNVAVLHGQLREKSDFSGVIGAKELIGRGIDYIALGHYHSYSAHRIDERTVAVYSGTPEGRGFDETGACGYVEINIDGSSVEHKFVPFAKRTLHVLDADVTDCASDMALVYKIETLISKIPTSDLLRIRLVGTRKIGRSIDTQTILSALRRPFYYVEVKDDTRLKISADDFRGDVSLKGEFIRGVLEDDTLSEKEKESVINLGLSVLMEEV